MSGSGGQSKPIVIDGFDWTHGLQTDRVFSCLRKYAQAGEQRQPGRENGRVWPFVDYEWTIVVWEDENNVRCEFFDYLWQRAPGVPENIPQALSEPVVQLADNHDHTMALVAQPVESAHAEVSAPIPAAVRQALDNAAGEDDWVELEGVHTVDASVLDEDTPPLIQRADEHESKGPAE